MPATDRVLQVGNANFASPVPAASKFSKPQKARGQAVVAADRGRPILLASRGPVRHASEPTRVASAPLTGSRRVANFRHASGAVPRSVARRRVGAHRVGPRRLDAAVRQLARRLDAARAHARLARRGGTGGAADAAPGAGGAHLGRRGREPPRREAVRDLPARGAAALGRARRLPPLLRVRPPRPHAARAWGLPAHRALCSGGAGELPALPPGDGLLAGRDEHGGHLATVGALQLWLDVVLDRLSQGVYNEKAWDAFRQFLGVPW